MSHSIVKQALQLVQEDLQTEGDEPSSSSKGKKRKIKNAMKLIKTDRKGVWKELRRLQKQEQEKIKSKFEKPNFKSSIEKFQEDQVVLQAKKGQRPQATKAQPSKNAKKVFEHHLKHFNRRNASKELKQEEETTVFTDKDFDKFEEEYDFFK
ncbi:active regulator of SIRT1-like [Littorina saxatilis]|uniref:Active regulator of SIRT1 n=1 Tax=Littorina saxatilis TaxID=31220 RepID=A0AAN9BV17_9CAEN